MTDTTVSIELLDAGAGVCAVVCAHGAATLTGPVAGTARSVVLAAIALHHYRNGCACTLRLWARYRARAGVRTPLAVFGPALAAGLRAEGVDLPPPKRPAADATG